MIMALDSLSLLFIGCFLLGLLFLLITAFSGHGIVHHMGSHIGHVGHTPMVHTTHGAHTASHAGHTTTHTSANNGHGSLFPVLAILNPLNIALFLISFGFFGYILYAATAFTLPLIVLLACISGLAIVTILIAVLNPLFGNATGETIQDVSERTGLLAKVNMPIPQKGIGEIIYVSPGGMRKSVPARSVDGRRLEREQEVVVLGYNGGIAEVDTWEHFIDQE